jgi:flagellar biosynthesis activator protein FlaF
MYRQGAAAYQVVAKQVSAPRDLEANLLSRSAANLQRVRDNWDQAQGELREALRFNRRLWNVFLSSVTRPESPLPRSIRENVANLGLFVLKHTITAEVSPHASKLDVLININRQLAAGLRAAAETAEH